MAPDDIERIRRTLLDFKEMPESKIVPNAASGYWMLTVERPLRLHSQLSLKAIEVLCFTSGDEEIRAALYDAFGDDLFSNFDQVTAALKKHLVEWGGDDEERQGDDAEDGASACNAWPGSRARGCSTPRPGSVMAAWPPGRLAAWPIGPRHCAKRWATRSSKTTTSSAIGLMRR